MKRINIFQNKKAGINVFMLFFAIFTLIIFIRLYIALGDKIETFEQPGSKIGEKQLAVLETASNGEKALFYIDIAAEYAYDIALLETAKKSYVDPTLCGSFRGATVVYGATDCLSYNEDLGIALEQKLGEEFSTAMTFYSKEYQSADLPVGKYFLTLNDKGVTGLSQEEILFPIFSTTSASLQRIEMDGEKTAGVQSFIFLWPVDYPEHYVTSCFGYREIEEGSRYHEGVDIRAKGHVSVYSVLPGTVKVADLTKKGMVLVDHGNGISTIYLHLDTIAVVKDQKVAQGTILGTSGATGTEAEHLHFELINENVDQVVDQYGYKGVLANEEEGKVNPLCFFSSELEYDYNPIKEKNCVANGGHLRFCDLYAEQSGVSTSITTTGITYTPSASTKERLQQIDTTYGSIIDTAIAGTSVPKPLVVAVIMTESGGNPTLVSSTGCAGLMQFCKGVAYDYGLCSDAQCNSGDNRKDPTKAIPAGVQLLQDNLNVFDDYKESVAFSLAAYNGGAGLIKKAIAATGKSDPTWSEVSAQITEGLIAEVYSDAFSTSVYEKNFGTTEKRNKKVKEVRDYANKVLNYYYAYEQLQKENTNKEA